MKNENGYWIDENNNKWNKNIYSEEAAKKWSKTLINCYYCTNCTNCTNCTYCRYCRDCTDCTDCTNCTNCTNCTYCSNFEKNPNRYIGNKIGSRKAQTVVYWLKDNIQVVCGCFKGNLIEFENRINEVYRGKNEQYYNEYMQYINIVKTIIQMEGE